MKTNEIYFKITCYFGFSQLPCLYKQLRINDTLLDPAQTLEQVEMYGKKYRLLKVLAKFFFLLFCLLVKLILSFKNNVWHLVT